MTLALNGLNEQFIDYVLRGKHRNVSGWIEPGALAATTIIDRLQLEAGISGSVAEIGVHHGRFFIALRLLLRPGERALAIDIFDDQHLNVDRSGYGSIEKLRENLTQYAGSLDGVLVLKADSLTVTPEQVLRRLGGPVRIFSVDGCHTAVHTENDLRLAAAVLAPGGVVIVDDIFNPEWPGVLAGVTAFFGAGDCGDLIPIVATDNKLILCHENFRERYLSGLLEILGELQGDVAMRDFLDVKVIGQPFPSLDLLLRSSDHARAFGRPLIRAMRFTSNKHPSYRLGRGWSSPESWGTWTDGSEASLFISLASPVRGPLMIEALAQGFVGPGHPRLKVELRTEGRDTGIWFFEGDDSPRLQLLRVSARRTEFSTLSLDIGIEVPRSPKELGLSDDTRRLGLGLRAMKILQAEDSPNVIHSLSDAFRRIVGRR